ncbi:hypothetical protein L6R50_13365 [Myxococcota bacterium]|nr:hypothetical protein [Myxococcota bacterium]
MSCTSSRALSLLAAGGALATSSLVGCFTDRAPLPLDERVVMRDYAAATSAGWRAVLVSAALVSESCGWTPELFHAAAHPDVDAGEESEDFRPDLFSDVLLGSVGFEGRVAFTQPTDAYSYEASFTDWAFLGAAAPSGTAEIQVTFRDEDGAAVPPLSVETSQKPILGIDVGVDVDLTGDVTAGFEVQGGYSLTDFEDCPGLSPRVAGEVVFASVGLVDNHTFSINPQDDDAGIGPLRWDLPHGSLPPAVGDEGAALDAFVAVWPDSGEFVDVGRGAVFRYSQAITQDFADQAGPTLAVSAESEGVTYAVDVSVWEPDLGVLDEASE